MDVMLQLDCLNMSVSDNANQAIVKVEPNPLLQQFQRGECFTSFEEFLSILSQYQQQNHVFFVRESGERLKFEPTLMERLVYKNVLFVCKQGRRKDPPRAKIRPNQTVVNGIYKSLIGEVELSVIDVHGECTDLEVEKAGFEEDPELVSRMNRLKLFFCVDAMRG
ncbi:hypothetical protein PoB_004133400 [Plakobranchus ocellatus]|uniref:ZSWIM3 N-terminal domain-containing protein n=1 Tax=Plakobranchus ocellatus TaxID=259542 RepID=A0AAV4B811_9GAST|nr:hypothetical protein PoB_004133400 [Plakobranchus ocellatus]